MKSSRSVAFLPHLFAAIDTRQYNPPHLSPRRESGKGKDHDGKHEDFVDPLLLPSSYFELSGLSSPGGPSASETKAAIRRTIKSLSSSLSPEEAHELLILLNRRKTAPLPLVPEVKVRKPRLSSPVIHTREVSHRKYLEQLSKPRHSYSRRLGSQSLVRRCSRVDQREVCVRLARHRSFEAVIRRYTKHESREQSCRSNEADRYFPNIPLQTAKATDLGPYTHDTELLIPSRRCTSGDPVKRTTRILKRLLKLSGLIMNLVDTGERVVSGEFDDWVAEMLNIEVLPSLSRRFPTNDTTCSSWHPGYASAAPATSDLFQRISSYQPNKLLLLRLAVIKNRIQDKIRLIVCGRRQQI